MSQCGVLFVIAVNLLGTIPVLAREAERPVEISTSQGSVERMDFGKTAEGTPVELYVLKNGKIMAKVMTYGAILTEFRSRTATEKQVMSSSGLTTWTRTSPAILISGRRPAGSPTGSPRGNSRSTARNTSWPSTMAQTHCTAG